MIIKDVMTKNPVCVSEDTSIVEANEIMLKNGFGIKKTSWNYYKKRYSKGFSVFGNYTRQI